MNVEQIALLLTAVGAGALIQSVIKAVVERRKIGADATSVLTAAARELVEPLRQELANERAERQQEHKQHMQEILDEKAAARMLRVELDGALEECRDLRVQLAAAHDEIDALRRELRARLGES